jgi:hypothetical protein
VLPKTKKKRFKIRTLPPSFWAQKHKENLEVILKYKKKRYMRKGNRERMTLRVWVCAWRSQRRV